MVLYPKDLLQIADQETTIEVKVHHLSIRPAFGGTGWIYRAELAIQVDNEKSERVVSEAVKFREGFYAFSPSRGGTSVSDYVNFPKNYRFIRTHKK